MTITDISLHQDIKFRRSFKPELYTDIKSKLFDPKLSGLINELEGDGYQLFADKTAFVTDVDVEEDTVSVFFYDFNETGV